MEIEVNNSNFLNAKTCEAGDMVTFIDSGLKTQITLKDGKVKDVYNFTVSIDGKDLTYTPNNKALEMFVNEWGSNSDKWVGKQFKVKKVMLEIRGQELEVIRPILVKEEKVE